MKEFKVLSLVAATSSKKEKEAILRNNDTPTLRKILQATYDPFRTYRIKQVDFPSSYTEVQADISTELFQLLDLLATHTVGTKEAKAMIKRLLAKCTEEGADWVLKIITKDLKAGISASTINKAFPDLIPVFDVMLALPMVEPKSGEDRWDSITYGGDWIAESKEDGCRVIAVCDSKTVSFRTREGHELEALDYLAPTVLKFKPESAFVLDGEIVGSVYNENCAVARKNKEKGKNWVFAQGISMARSSKGSYPEDEMKRCLAYRVWDIVPYDFFLSQGKVGSCKPLKYRKTELAGLFEKHEGKLVGMEKMPNVVVNSKEEAIDFFKGIIANGGEGAMLKNINALYEFRRSPNMLKLKEFYSADLRIKGAIEGAKGTKYEGSLGALIVSDDEQLESEVGTGFDDDQRLELWFRHKARKLAGGIVEVLFQERTADNSLRLPVFVRERPDKTTVSFY